MSGKAFAYRVAVITGAASGIGFAVAERFAEEGAKIALLDRDEDKGPRATEQIRAAVGACEFFPVDVASESHVKRTLAEVIVRFGWSVA